jgi:plastocyanin
MRRFIVLMACSAVALVAFAGCSSSPDKNGSGSSGVPVVATDNAFNPPQLTAQAGTKMSVVLKNDGATLHNFSIDSLGVSRDVEAGKNATITFTPGSAGTLSFYCKYHQALGMTGTIVVSG